jgi:hypothetical protein
MVHTNEWYVLASTQLYFTKANFEGGSVEWGWMVPTEGVGLGELGCSIVSGQWREDRINAILRSALGKNSRWWIRPGNLLVLDDGILEERGRKRVVLSQSGLIMRITLRVFLFSKMKKRVQEWK